ncbi:hypothetical protein [Pedobacter sp. SYP-B3415]|uniref:hypothetical protein n=1 Tax=Pedobacter sp. SYP-B3415 TaxID=2496641 RepID=UPI00101BC791|nr:hypothetical protein [Pedobacter sp. SYP-B3415]
MINNKFFPRSITIIAITMIGFNLYLLHEVRNSRPASVETVKQSENYQSLYAGLASVKASELQVEGNRLQNVKLIGAYGETTLFNQLGSVSNIIFRISEVNCSTCVHQQLALLKRYKDSLGLKNILIIGAYSEFRKLKIAVSSTGIPDESIFIAPKNSFDNLFVENQNVPYYLVVDKQKLILRAFVPLVEQVHISQLFLSSFLRKYIGNRNE